jgi:hypothetical protein
VRPTGAAAPPVPRGAPREAGSLPYAEPQAGSEESSLTESAIDRLESYCLGALVRHPDLVAKADRQLRAWRLAPLGADDFSHTDLQIIFNALKAALDQHQVDPREHLQAQLDETFMPRLRLLLEASEAILAEDRRRIEDVLSAVVRLRKRNIDYALHELRFLQEAAHADADADQETVYQEQIYNLVKSLQKVTSGLKHHLHRAERFGAVGLN